MLQRETRTLVKNSIVQLSRDNDSVKQYRVLNISRGGLCFEAGNEEFEINETLKLNVKMDNNSILQANGRVCYCSLSNTNSTYGLSFLDHFIDTDILRNYNFS